MVRGWRGLGMAMGGIMGKMEIKIAVLGGLDV